jgi:hypothetical protein
MSENRPEDESLRKEFESLGRNLVEALRSAWEAPESRRLREEVSSGLNDLGSTLKREADNLASSPAAQKVQTSVGEVGEKLRSNEVQEKVRHELIDALQTVNSELQKVIDRWSDSPAAAGSDSPAPDETPAPEQPGFQAADFSQPAPGHNEVTGFDAAGPEKPAPKDTPSDLPIDQA